MRISIRNDLPIHPWKTDRAKYTSPFLDARISGAATEWRTNKTAIVGGVPIACAPLLHEKLFAVLFCLGDIGQEFGPDKVANAIYMDGEDI